MSKSAGMAVVLAALTLGCGVAQTVFLAAGGMALWGAAALDRGFPLITLATLAGAVVGALILSRHPRHPIGWLFSIGQFGTAAGRTAEAYAWAVLDGELRGSPALAHVAAWLSTTSSVFLVSSLALLALLAPTGHLPSRRWRVVVYLLAASIGLVLAGLLLVPPSEMEPNRAPTASPLATLLVATGQVGLTVALLLGGIALVLRLRRASGEERQQLRWITVAAAVLALTLVAIVVHNLARGGNVPADWRLALLLSLASLGIPVATGFAVLRYRLYDIDVVIGAAVKAAALAVFVTGGYVAVVTVAAELLGQVGPPSFVASLLALVVVALAFQPLRRRLSSLADRVVYGRRADPYESLARFSRSLAERVPDGAVLVRFAEAVARATGAWQVEAQLALPGKVQTAAWPETPPSGRLTELPLPVRHGGDQLGEMRVRPAPGGSLSRTERRLAAELLEQAGLAFRNLRLDASLRARAEALARDTEELAASRRRLLAAEDTEREHLMRAIQRDVRRYLQPMTAELDRLPDLLNADPHAANQVLEQLETDANRALDALRDLTHGVFPSLLALRGLPAALEAYVQRTEGAVTLELDDAVQGWRLSPAAEAAGYFCCVETLTALTACCLRLEREGDQLQITGRGQLADSLTPEFEQRLTDRAEAVGGSVQVELDGLGGQLVVRVRLAGLAHQAAAA